MKKAKNIILSAIFGVMLSITSVFLISCAQGYENLSISSDVSEVTIEKGEMVSIKFTVENFGSAENGKLSISVYDGSSTSVANEGQSTNIAFTTSYDNNGVTTVVIEGKKGGESIIVATSSVGGTKIKPVKVNVKEYATQVTEKVGNLNYVTYGKDFNPSVNDYNFGESGTVTEKGVKFLYQENDLSNAFEFTRVSFNESNNKVVFYHSDQEMFSRDINDDLTRLPFKVQYSTSAEETATIDSYFMVLYGFNPDSVKFDGNTFTDDFKVTLIAEKTEGNEKSFAFDYSALNNVDITYGLKGQEFVSLVGTKKAEGKYEFTFANKTAKQSKSTLEITLAYKGFEGVEFEDDQESAISYTWEIPVEVLVKPTSIKVNNLDSNNDNAYVVYKNNYGEGGWVELNVEIFDKESTYTGYKVDFDDSSLQIKHGSVSIKNGDRITTNLQEPLYVRGKTTATVGDQNIVLSVISDAIDGSEDEVKNTVKMNVLEGATSLTFTDDEYEYSSTQENNGVYISNNKGSSEFHGLKANSQFNSFTMVYERGEDVVQLLTTEDFCEDDNALNMKLKPKKVGVGTYTIKLDNGFSKSVTFRVVDEFENLIVEQYRPLDANYNNVSDYISAENELFLRELSEGKSIATLTFTSSNGRNAIVAVECGNSNFVRVEQIEGQINEQKIEFKNVGSETVTFKIKGYTVDENNKRKEEEKTFELAVNCYSLAKSISIQDSGVTIKSVTLYHGDSVPVEESKKIVDVKLTDDAKAFGFFNHEDKGSENYKAELFNKNYVLWMTDKDITNITNSEDESIYMRAGNVYRIGNIATFNPTTMEISTISGGVFNLTAVVMQHGATQYYTISVLVTKYDQVETLSFEEKWTGLKDSVQFTDKYNEESFIVYVSGVDMKKPTITRIAVLASDSNEESVVGDVNITQLTELSYRVTVKKRDNGTKKTSLQFVAESWLGVSGQVNEEYASKVISIDIEYADGTETNPYRIDSAEDFKNIQSNKHYTISKEINLSEEIFFDFDFSGSIKGTNSTAKISGITTSSGLFKKISGSITNLAFSGVISGNIAGDVGLIAKENSGTLTNVSVRLAGSTLTATGDVNLGGVVGLNSGTIRQDFTKNDISMISSITTVFMDGTIEIINESHTVYAGGIAGKNTGIIEKIPQSEYTRFNYEDYTAYTTFTLKLPKSSTSTSLNGYLGGISGYSEGEKISGVLVGGCLSATQGTVGGLAGKSSNMKLAGDIKVRTFIEGKKLGFISGEVVNAVVNADLFENSATLTIQAIGDKNNTSMFKRVESDSDVIADTDEGYIKNFVLVANRLSDCGYSKNNISFESYVVDDGHYDCVMGTDGFYKFAKATKNTITPSNNSKFKEMKNESDDKMYYMYYFEASEYMRNGSFTSEDLTTAQDVLDKHLNKVKINSTLSPFTINLNDTKLKSSNTNILSVEGNYLVVHATGFVELTVSSLLNETNEAKIKVLVINYFDAMQEISPLKVGDQGLGENVTITLYDKVNKVINISPKLSNEFEIDGKTIEINEEGILTLEKTVIKLSDRSQITTNITCSDTNKYAVWEAGEKQVILSRSGTPSSNSENKLTITTTISYEIGSATYSCQIGNSVELTIKYKQGATGIYSNRDTYIMDSSQTQKDVVTLETDEKVEEGVIVKIYGDSYTDIVYEEEKEDSLFAVENNYNSETMTANITISVNKNSSAYKNRWEKDIFKDYIVRYLAKTTGESNGVYKEVTLTLDNQTLNTVVVDNYSNINNLSMISNSVVPSQEGVLSMTIVPGDLDFQTIEVSNASINSQPGSAKTTLRVGYLDNGQKFVALTKGVIYSEENHKVTITREGLIEELSSFDGQLYIGYIFANDSSVTDGTTVGFDIKIIGRAGAEIYSDTITYNVNKKFIFNVSIPNKEAQAGAYYVASGLRYELNVENEAFAEVEILSTNSGLGKIVKEDDKYYLEISSINNYSTDQQFDVKYSAWRLDLSGNKITSSGEFKVKVLKYVVNYKYDDQNNANDDIVEGMENGKMSIAVGDKKTFALDFNNYAYLEYDSTNLSTVNEVMNFLDNARKQGKWIIYTNFTDLGFKKEGYAGNVSPTKYTKTYELNQGTKYSTEYFEVDGYSFLPKKSQNSSEEINYMMTFEVGFEIENGGYTLLQSTQGVADYNKFKTNILMDAYLRGSEESPNPITSYKDLKESMKNAGSYYILMNNITVSPEDFEPIAMNAESLDGNGYEVVLSSGEYSLGGLEEAGFFSTISEPSVLKNFTIRISNGVQFKSTQTNSLSFGMIASKNEGIITNTKVIGETGAKLDLDFTTEPRVSGFILAGLVAENSGKITNSKVTASIDSNISIAGFVGNNSGTIASSYYMGGSITNTSKEPVYFTAGFVLSNSQYGRILTSYTSGIKESGKAYADGTISRLVSSVNVSAFIIDNEGYIQDCYANMPISTSASSFGFVMNNLKEIKNCFTTSKVQGTGAYSATNYYFAYQDTMGDNVGKFENCFYLSDIDSEVNPSLAESKFAGVSELDISGFDKKDNFSSYSYVNSEQEGASVWAYSSTYKRFELVSANKESFSQKAQLADITDSNGNVIHQYKTISEDDGSESNPYLIYTAEQLENYMFGGRNKDSRCTARSYYRLIGDIDYSKYDEMTKLYNVTLAGVLEGNGMVISGVEIVSDVNAEYSGLFSKIQGSLLNPASVMNLTIIPTKVSFVNSDCVGALAGLLSNANITNIKVYNDKIELNPSDEMEDKTEKGIIVTGKHIVGGVVGYAVGNYKASGIISLVGAKSNYINQGGVSSNVDIEKASFAGSVMGLAGNGQGVIRDVKIRGANNIAIAQNAGLVFGALGSGVKVDDVTVNMNEEMFLRAYSHGGIVAGYSYADLNNIYVKGTGTDIELFKLIPYVPSAVGGIAGRICKGSLNNIYMGQSFNVSEKTSTSGSIQGVTNVGGIIGQVDSRDVKISNVIVEGNVSTKRNLGGIIGFVDGSVVNMENIAIHKINLTVSGRNSIPRVGGFVANISNTARVIIKDAYSHANIVVNTYVYDVDTSAYVGAILAVCDGTYSFENIYTTTTYDVTVSDNSASSSVSPVGYKATHSTNASGPTKYIWSEVGERNIEFTLNENGSNTKDVYFFMVKHDTEGSQYYYKMDSVIGQNGTTYFKAKFNTKQISLKQNEYGISLGVYKGYSYVDPIEEKDYYNLFEGGEKWVSSLGSLSTLKFEEELLSKTK